MQTVARRLALVPPVLLGVAILAFNLPAMAGLDPVATVLRARSSERAPDPEVIAALEAELGLDRGPFGRFLTWAGGAMTGDFGNSFVSGGPVADSVASALTVSLTLVGSSLLVALVGGVMLAVSAALAPHGRLDRAVAWSSQIGVAVPEYALAPLLILVFAVTLGGLPSSGWDGPASMVLPVMTVSLPALAFCTQMIRAELLDRSAHLSTTVARAKGVGERRVVWRHVLPQALTGAFEILGLWLVGLLGGSVVVEVIFAIPGLGRLLYASVLHGDIPMLQGGLVATVAVSMVVILAVDLLRTWLDPRLRRQEGL